MDVPEHRRWMYNRTGPQRVGIKDVFVKGVDEFIAYACQSETRARNGTIRCPCVKCKCKRFADPDLVKLHLYKNGFKEMYGYWTSHGEMLPPLHPEQSNDQTTCDEDYQEQCNQNEAMVAKRNRASSKGDTINTGGSIPFSEHRRRLSKEMESNSKPNLVDTFRRTHKRKDTDEFVDHKSAMAYAEYDDIDEVSRDNTCWIEAMGDRYKKRRIFGVGSETKTIQSSSSRTSNQSSLHPEFQHELERCLSSYIEVANKEKELLQRELAKKEELLKRELAKKEELLQRELAKKDEQLAKKDEQMQMVLKNYDAQFQAIFSRLNVHPTPINPNDEDQQRPTRH